MIIAVTKLNNILNMNTTSSKGSM
jgi:hypothetical protein